ncbi:AI-2E family transporter [Priestia filamentosa]|uniref:AI-2E family transporter n=1 Tax=Priestia filamentosa TaxID=1402861 RepID=UPI0005895F33
MKNPFFRIGFGVLLICIIIFMLKQISFIFKPLIVLFNTLSLPFIIAGILYYLLLPAFNFLQKKGLNKILSIISIYVSLALVIVSFFVFMGPMISKQVKLFIENVPSIAHSVGGYIQKGLHSDLISSMHLSDKISSINLGDLLTNEFNKIFGYIGDNLFNIMSTVTNFAFLLIIVPFVLFYLLKDGDKIPGLLTRGLSPKSERDALKILSEMNHALSSYIQGQILVSFIVGVMVYIGYLIIGLDFPLLMALIAMVTNLIPFVGPYIGLSFALVVGLMNSFETGLFVCLVVLIVQQIESNFISPQIIGNKLRIHPLTIILLLLFAGKLAGFMGLILGVPIYAVLKVIITNAYTIWKIRNNNQKKAKSFPDFVD